MDGYGFDSGSFQGVRETWLDLQAGLRDDSAAVEQLLAVVAPGHEPASGFVASTQQSSGEALRTAITQMQAFVDGYVNGLGQSAKEYDGLETSGSRTFGGGR